ncbi:hypothetical protein HDV57DRAFT_492625 [Trichoderma longibrachiatum]
MCYSMERDSRRGHGQWRGCFAFQNVMYDHGSSHHDKRSGGLKMGHTYFYYVSRIFHFLLYSHHIFSRIPAVGAAHNVLIHTYTTTSNCPSVDTSHPSGNDYCVS